MGKRPRRQHGRKGAKKSKPDGECRGFSDWVYTNDKFVQYYKSQNIVPEDEWEDFMTALAKPLPTTFRINNTCAFAEKIRERIENEFKFQGLEVDGEQVAPISEMPWYPDRKGFQWSVERRKIRKLPILSQFQKWLVEISDSGSITRQEAVSMIPPLVLDVQPHHRVLDMCAAPGSKTSQLLEALHAEELATGRTPTGMVVANDVDLKRSYMLVHQSKRIGSPALVVTCQEAQRLPFPGDAQDESLGYYDRVLCDAPCSGDGTLRKNPIIWRNWDVKNGMSLHPLQKDIVKRGASLLKVGGYMCYSTCTFNPLENEAIVAELLRWGNGALELVDVSQTIPLLERRPGISNWTVMNSNMTTFTSVDQVQTTEEMPKRQKNKLTSSMFPPTEEEAQSFHLDRCMRCLPHDQDTGGFFICLIKKTAPTPELKVETKAKKNKPSEDVKEAQTTSEVESKEEEKSAEAPAVQDAEEARTEESAAIQQESKEAYDNRSGSRRQKNTEYDYVSFPSEHWSQLQPFYNVSDDFSTSQLLVREGDSKSITFVSESITLPMLERMKAGGAIVVYTGIKMFERTMTSDGDRNFRLCQAGLPHLLPFMRSRFTTVSRDEFQMMLERQGQLLDFDDFAPDTEKLLQECSVGSIACCLRQEGQTEIEKRLMNVVIWRGRNSVNVMTNKADITVLLSAMKELQLYSEDAHDAIMKNKEEKDAARAARDGEKQE